MTQGGDGVKPLGEGRRRGHKGKVASWCGGLSLRHKDQGGGTARCSLGSTSDRLHYTTRAVEGAPVLCVLHPLDRSHFLSSASGGSCSLCSFFLILGVRCPANGNGNWHFTLLLCLSRDWHAVRAGPFLIVFRLK